MNLNTTDLILAATLIVHGCRNTNITVEGSRGTFHFLDVPDEFIMEYELGKILVEPVIFNGAIKRLTTAVRRLSGQHK
jgi:hypothetical protein